MYDYNKKALMDHVCVISSDHLNLFSKRNEVHTTLTSSSI